MKLTKWDYDFEKNDDVKAALACASMVLQLKKWHSENLTLLKNEHLQVVVNNKKTSVVVMKDISAKALKLVPISPDVYMTRPGTSVPTQCLDLGAYTESARRHMYIKPICEPALDDDSKQKQGTVNKDKPKEFISPFFACGDNQEWTESTLDVTFWKHDGFQVPIFTNEGRLKKGTVLTYFRPARATRKYDFGEAETEPKKPRTG